VTVRILQGDVLETLRSLPDGSVQCVVTSPPYWGLRDYGTARWEGGDPACDHARHVADGPKQTPGNGSANGHAAKVDRLGRHACGKCGAKRIDQQLGSEATPAEYIANMVEVFSEVWRVLRDDGICWLNMGDSYANVGGGGPNGGLAALADKWQPNATPRGPTRDEQGAVPRASRAMPPGLKPKDLVGMPWMLAFALRDWGWWLRRDVIWDKPNPMPESVTDRPGTAHEYVFMLTKSGSSKYWVHRDHAGARSAPPPDYRWIDLDASDLDAVEGNKVQKPTGWASGPGAHGNVNAAGRSEAIYHAANQRLAETDVEPENWRTEKSATRPGKRWRRINLWEGRDYFWDMEAVRVAGAVPAGTRAAKGSNVRSELKNVNGRPPEYWVYTGKRNIRSVWRITTVPYAKAHFATFPPALPERCIKAASSEVGCCSGCGAPWARQLSVTRTKGDGGSTGGRRRLADPNDSRSDQTANTKVHNETTGWLPTCQCNAGDPVPCVVLDPFGGAGTTGMVADRLGRDAILIELNPEYCEMARQRLIADSPLFARVAAE
jgi:DNA modification methylase